MYEIKIKIPEYNPDVGIVYNWERNFEIKTRIENNCIVILANREGLISLANHLINLAQERIPSGYHLHFDEFNSLEEGSKELIIEKK